MSEQTIKTPAEAPRTERGLERLIFFSDAVVAIAITLIALPLIDSARDVTNGSTSKFLSENVYAFIAAAITFAAVSAFWRDHHSLFERATGYTPMLLRANMFWLVGIVALPVVTVLDVYSRHDSLAAVVYLIVMIFTMSLSRIEELILYRAHLLSDEDTLTRTALALRWSQVVAACIAMVVSLAFPRVGLWSLLVVVLGSVIERIVGGRRAASD
ncbi:TMEM175 family protein [Nocardia alni]|uniref:TMEM175 family protein n=1 Tax=Nocardia alni TaxID=2815723 RepID=UPI001C22FD94|nr:TMEM175 family protein [Nocardia alni]